MYGVFIVLVLRFSVKQKYEAFCIVGEFAGNLIDNSGKNLYTEHESGRYVRGGFVLEGTEDAPFNESDGKILKRKRAKKQKNKEKEVVQDE